MKRFLLIAAMFAGLVSPAATTTRVPPPGLRLAESDREELTRGAAELERRIEALRTELAGKPALLALMPDVQIFHKAVAWPLRYDEFYRSNEVAIARDLLKRGLERAEQLRAGQTPWLSATGLVVRGYISRLDGSVQPYGLVVPAGFTTSASRPHRLDVWLHGRDNNLTELKFISDRLKSPGEFAPSGAFVLHPYGRYCNAFKFAGEIDVFEAMEQVRKSYPIDPRRLAIRGFSMGGAGAWHLAAHHPDLWAVAAPGAGFSETAEYTGALKKSPPSPWEQKLWQLYDATDYAANFRNLPVVAYNGTEDKQRQAADMMEQALRAEGIVLPRVWGTNVGHKYTPEAKREGSRFVDDAITRGKSVLPPRVHFTTRTLRYNRGPLVAITGLEKHWQRADLIVDLTTLPPRVRTTNVTAFTLNARDARIPSISVDGQPPIEATGASAAFALRKGANGKWKADEAPPPPGTRKLPGLQGPIDDAFMDSFLVVRPGGKPQDERVGAWTQRRLANATNEWRAQFRGDVRLKVDSDVNEADIAAHNLILFGDPQSNRLLARILPKLPLRWTPSSVQIGGREFPATESVPVLIYPNPLNPQRYVVLNSGFTFAAAGAGSNAQQTPKLPDYAVLEVGTDRVSTAGFFDEAWRP